MTRRPVFAAALTIALAACAPGLTPIDQLPAREYAGHVTTAGQGYWFRSCAAPADSLWVTFVDRAVAQMTGHQRAGLFTAGQPTYVRWFAARTDDGRVGPGGPALLVRDIAEARAAAEGDCGAP